MLKDMRCKRCKKKIGEHDIKNGTVGILCHHRFEGKACKTLNTFHVSPASEQDKVLAMG